MSFANKVVLITGASSGIGAGTALEFAALEAILVITGRNSSNLDQVAASCEQASPKRLKPFSIIADMTKKSDIEDIMKSTIKKYKRIDVLVNNAGILANGSIETTTLDQYDRVMNTNLRGSYYLTMLATPHLIKSKGNIVNVSSVVGLRSFPEILAYCISKAAMDQFTRCVALELGAKGVRVNAVNPGLIITDIHKRGGMSEQQYAAFVEHCKNTYPIQRAGEPKEVATAITFLAGDDASNITGVTLPVDGGKHALCPR